MSASSALTAVVFPANIPSAANKFSRVVTARLGIAASIRT